MELLRAWLRLRRPCCAGRRPPASPPRGDAPLLLRPPRAGPAAHVSEGPSEDEELAHWRARALAAEAHLAEAQAQARAKASELEGLAACCAELRARLGAAGAAGAGAEGEAPEVTEHGWRVGARVERLLDDVSDIWLGATVVAAGGGDVYSVEYADDGTIEHEVEGSELRPRRRFWDFPLEVWERVGSCMDGKEELASFELVGRLPRAAALAEAQVWWCASYHNRFGRCGPRCGFLGGGAGRRSLGEVVRRCTQAAAEGLTTADRTPWKQRYHDQERLETSRHSPENRRRGSPGDAAYCISGKKVDYDSPTKNMFFDPRMGKMVREC